MTDETVLQVEHLRKDFPSHGDTIHAVNDVAFDIKHGETFALVGESGSGKTTVGRCILRLIEPTAGTIYFEGERITSIQREGFRKMRYKLQTVFQEPHAALNPRMKVKAIVEEPLLFGPSMSAAARRDRVAEVLSLVRLGPEYAEKYPHHLTGSEAQRIGIARAIATSPKLVILDEPTSLLDVSSRAEIIDLLATLIRQLDISYLFISHDLTAVYSIADRVAVMYLGQLVETAKTAELFSYQRHPYSRALLSATLFPDPERRIPPFQLAGEIPSPKNLPNHCYLAGRCPLAMERCWTEIPPLEEVEHGRFAACLRWKEVPDAIGGRQETPELSRLGCATGGETS